MALSAEGWTYDAAGNLLDDGTTPATSDALHRLTQQGGTNYQYNGDGVLVTAGTTTYAQDLAAPLSQVLSDGSTSSLYGHERLAALGQSWSVGDALGSVRQTLDGTGNVLATTSYDPWGGPQYGLLAPFGVTGELHAQERVYLRARWYAPGNGTLTSRDPFAGWPEQPSSLHPYQDAYSNPVLFTDPTGQFAQCALAVATGPAFPLTGGLCVVATAAVAAATGVALGTLLACTGGISCHPGAPVPGPAVIPGPGPRPPDAQPGVLPDGPRLPQTFVPPVPASGPTPPPAPGGHRPPRQSKCPPSSSHRRWPAPRRVHRRLRRRRRQTTIHVMWYITLIRELMKRL